MKIVLDVINKLVAKPFAKAFPSSASGMEKSNHGWNVYKAFFTGALRDMVFTPSNEEVTTLGDDAEIRDITWETVYASSTDFDTATDFMSHEVAWICARGLMTKVGIPRLLMGIVRATCFHERTIEFTGTGALKSWGTTLDESTRLATIRTGVMMGDPLTKVVLHMVNMLTREISEAILNGLPVSTHHAFEIQTMVSRALDESSAPPSA